MLSFYSMNKANDFIEDQKDPLCCFSKNISLSLHWCSRAVCGNYDVAQTKVEECHMAIELTIGITI